MAGFFQTLLGEDVLGGIAGGFFGNDYLRDFQHASKVFTSNGYAYSPKFKFLFHVYFEINKDLIGNQSAFPADGVIGLAVKTIQLPSYSFATSNMNQYNRKRVVQTKINYDDISITFHDDNANLIRNMWYSYYTYYYKDATKTANQSNATTPNGQSFPSQDFATSSKPFDYNRRNIYDESIFGDEDWGYIGETANDQVTGLGNAIGSTKAPFFKSIEIYGFNQHNFSMYKIINPTITAFKHDTYDYSSKDGTMENTMTLAYETVKYADGYVDGSAIGSSGTSANATAAARDFGMFYYDRTVSPISRPGANQTILGQGGLVDAAGGAINDLANGNILGAISTAGRSYNTYKNGGLKNAAISDLRKSAGNAIINASNRNTPFSSPTYKGG